VSVGVGLALLAGLFFQAVAALGVVRMPDVYTRLHAVSKAETLGLLLTLLGVGLSTGPGLTTVKVGLVALFLFLANPTATHAITRAALRLGVPPWERPREAGR
jgi:multicomponent Na+:H+ antiporter subunit G